MTSIVAGNFEGETRAEEAVRELSQQGIPAERVCKFHINAQGQNASFPIGGEQDESPGARSANSGAAIGAAIGGAIGLAAGVATTPLVGPVLAPGAMVGGAGVGAYVGSLAGTLGKLGKENEKPEDRLADTLEGPPRPAGVIVAVAAPDNDTQSVAVRILSRLDARQVEVADGTWADGQWADFDPVTRPKLVHQDQQGNAL